MPRKKPGRGKTTVSPRGLIKKTFWFHPDEVHVLRKAAYEQETSQTELVRTAVRLFFDMPPEEEATGEDLAEDVSDDVRSSPALRHDLERLLQDYTRSPEQAVRILETIDDPTDDDEESGDG
ncbi:MAG: hypothetical protein GY725_10880 [bacterium]|nr:hypothetical protein [bacterium]